MKKLPPLVLASSSPARRLLMGRLQIPFQHCSPDVDETPFENETPEALVKRLALKKALAVVSQFPNSLIIACDQVGTFDGDIICKPHTHEKAVQQLLNMSGKEIKFLTAICLYDTRTHHFLESTELYHVTFRTLTLQEIEDYLVKEKPYQCAGSVQVEGLGITLLDKLKGDDYTALIGLPLMKLSKMLREIR